MDEAESPAGDGVLYCPQCAAVCSHPLVCGDCRAVICNLCGAVLEQADELGIG